MSWIQRVVEAVIFGQGSKIVRTGPIEISPSLHQHFKSGQEVIARELEPFTKVDLKNPIQVVNSLTKYLEDKVVSKTSTYLHVPHNIQKRLNKIVYKWLHGLTGEEFISISAIRGDTSFNAWQMQNSLNSIIARGYHGDGYIATGTQYILAVPRLREMIQAQDPQIAAYLPEKLFVHARVQTQADNRPVGQREREIFKVSSKGDPVYWIQLFFGMLVKTEGIKIEDATTYPQYIKYPSRETDSSVPDAIYTDPDLLISMSLYESPTKHYLHERILDSYWKEAGMVSLYNAYYVPNSWRPITKHRCETINLDSPYKGAELELIEEWNLFMQKKIPITVLLQGRPGSGKTTLVKTALKIFHAEGKRVLITNIQVLETLETQDWFDVLASLDPDVLWIDDIDRMQPDSMDKTLGKIDRNNYKIPLTIFTANNYKKLPQALYRPDRIDYIYKIDVKEGQVDEVMLEEVLRRVGVDISSLSLDNIEDMRQLCRGRTPAEMLKYARRGVVLGFDKLKSAYDLNVYMTDELEEPK